MKKYFLTTVVAAALNVAAVPFFSENFDGDKFSPGTLKNKNGIAIVTEPVVSAPHALQVARNDGPETTDVRFAFPQNRSVNISFEIFINEKSRGDISFLNQKGKYSLNLSMRAGQVPYIKGDGVFLACHDIGKLPAGKWLKFELLFNAADNSCAVACTIDGKRVVDSKKVVLADKLPLIGLRFFNSPNGGSAFYDNITATESSEAETVSVIQGADADKKRIMDHLNSPVAEYWKWVFYGDSITQCYNNSRGFRSFSELFNECLRYECGFHRRKDVVINSGLSGHNSINLSHDSNFVPLVLAYKPQVVFIMIGANDIVVPDMNIDKFKANMTAMVKRVRAEGAIPILMTYNTMLKISNPVEQWQKNYLRRYNEFPAWNEAIRQVASDCDCLLIDHNKHWQENAADETVLRSWMDDELHPGARGQFEMARVILNFFNMAKPNSRVLTNLPPAK